MSKNERKKIKQDKEMEVGREGFSEDSRMKGGRQPYGGLQGGHFHSEKRAQRPRGSNHPGQLVNRGVWLEQRKRGGEQKKIMLE